MSETTKPKSMKLAIEALETLQGEAFSLRKKVAENQEQLSSQSIAIRNLTEADTKNKDEITRLKKELENEKSTKSMYMNNAATYQKEIAEMHGALDLVPGIIPQVERDEKETWRDKNYSLMQRFVSYLIKQKC